MNETHPASAHEDADVIVVLNRDLFFGVRIANMLRDRGYRVEMAPTIERFVDLVQKAIPSPALGVIDMTAVSTWSQVNQITGEEMTPLLAFGPHKDVEAFRAAKDAGVNRVVSNGDFHRDMLGMIERYARSHRRNDA